MSGQENQEQGRAQDSQPSQRESAPGLDDLAMASVLLPMADLRPSLLDYLFYSGIELRPVVDYRHGGVGGGADDAAFILANSLYDRRPVKQVIDDEGCVEIRDEIFHPDMVEKMKINAACGIWQADFEEGDKIKILPCNHAFGADAIMKWLKEEKAECPICRKALKSKEIICHDHQGHQGHAYAGAGAHVEYDDEEDDNEDDGEDDGEQAPNEEARQNENINNIAARVAQNMNGRQNHLHQQLPRGYHESISVPIRQLIESRRNLVSYYRSNGGAARAVMPSMGGAAHAHRHHEPREARAAPVYRREDNQDADIIIDNNNNDDINNINNINNNGNPIINNIINNFYYNYISNDVNQEEADIQEAIRRSLEEN
jgi:Ring finger domain